MNRLALCFGKTPFSYVLLIWGILSFTAVAVTLSDVGYAQTFKGKELYEIRTRSGALAQGESHVQGICCDEEAIYLSFANYLYKIDWSGKVLSSVSAVKHSGDICCVDGRLYVSMSSSDQKGVYEYDTNLKLLRKLKLEKGPATDGIAFLNGSFFIGGPSTDKPHTSNLVLEYNRDFHFIREHYVDFGVQTFYGPQAMTAWNNSLFFAFYTAPDALYRTIQTDKNMKVLGRYSMNSSNGLALVPPSKQGKRPRFIKAETVELKQNKIVVIRWLELDKEELRDITVL